MEEKGKLDRLRWLLCLQFTRLGLSLFDCRHRRQQKPEGEEATNNQKQSTKRGSSSSSFSDVKESERGEQPPPDWGFHPNQIIIIIQIRGVDFTPIDSNKLLLACSSSFYHHHKNENPSQFRRRGQKSQF
jgi:hypothetical protein